MTFEGLRNTQINIFCAEALDDIVCSLEQMQKVYNEEAQSYEETAEEIRKRIVENPEDKLNPYSDWEYIAYCKAKAKSTYIENVISALTKGKL